MTQLLVLCHGMWGNINHFDYLVEELQRAGGVEYNGDAAGAAQFAQFSDPATKFIIYRTNSNTGYFTYDGIDVCGARVCAEINAVIDDLENHDVNVGELSLYGYSMGGVMVRFAAGMLYTQGLFDRIKAGTLTTMFSPHVGVNVLGTRKSGSLFNFVGSWSMARTSRQMFLQDRYEKSDTPLFKHLIDSESPYAKAAKLFKRRVLYANIVNDRRCEYYTAAVEKRDPFAGRAANVTGSYVPGYSPIVFENVKDVDFDSAKPTEKPDPFWLQWPKRALRILVTTIKVVLIIPIWFVAFLLNAAYQTVLSRLRTHTMVSNGHHLPEYDFSAFLEREASDLVEQVYAAVDSDSLELTPVMNTIIDGFNSQGWEKHPVHILADKNAHAAAINRLPHKKSYHEGRIVIKHWVDTVIR